MAPTMAAKERLPSQPDTDDVPTPPATASSSTATSTRIIVKNLPAYLTEERLRAHFSSSSSPSPNLTDSRLVRSKDGTSRRFAFLGFADEAQAIAARDYFDRTYIDTSRIQVQIAKAIGDESLEEKKARLAKRRGEGNGGAVVEEQPVESAPPPTSKKEKKERKEKTKGGVSFDEFLAVMSNTTTRNKAEKKEVQVDPDVYQQQPKAKKTKRGKEKGAPEESALPPVDPQGDAAEDPAPADEAVHDDGLTDLEYMYRRMRKRVGGDDEEEKDATDDAELQEKLFEQSEDEAGAEESEEDDDDKSVASVDSAVRRASEAASAAAQAKREKDLADADVVMSSSRLFVRNLAFSTTEDDLKAWFEDGGQGGIVTEAHIPVDKNTKKSKGLGFVKFADPLHALTALRSRDGSTFQGRLVHVLPAVTQGHSASNDADAAAAQKKQTLKQSRAEARKVGATSARAEFEWGALYMSQDAVATSVAQRLGIDKSEILNPSEGRASDAAVRLALAETRVIQETREWLEREGIDVAGGDSGRRPKRSETLILVKNFAFGTSVETLRALFEPHGDVERVVLSPAGTLALVEMPVENESRKAFRAVAFKRLGSGIVYLEKAPVSDAASKKALELRKQQEGPVTVANAAPALVPAKPPASQEPFDESSAAATLYIKNLSFSTTTERLRTAFSSLSDFAFARVQMKPASNGSSRQSMGYGFVGFTSAGAARAAQAAMEGRLLDGHALSVSFAKRGRDDEDESALASKRPKGSSKGGGTKLVVKNLPFESSKSDVRALFAAHGTVRSVRAPRKAGGVSAGARGFAFVEFVSEKEAAAAREALRHTHLLGRHLVVDWAEKEDAESSALQAQRRAGLGLRAEDGPGVGRGDRREKVRLGEEDVAEAARKERAARMDVDE